MGEIVTALLLLSALITIYVLMLRSARSGRGPAKSFGALRYYKQSSWGVAMLSGFAVNEILDSLTRWGGTTLDAQHQITLLATALTLIVGVSCGLGAERSVLVTWPASIVGTFAAILMSIRLVEDSIQARNWLVVAMVMALGMLFGLMSMASLVSNPSAMKGLAWYTALEILVFLAGPFGVTLQELTGVNALILVLLQVAIPIALAWMPGILVNMFATAVVLGQVWVTFATGGSSLLGTIAYAGIALVAYLVGAFIRRRVSRDS
jgi:hypothetical protein